MAVRHELYAGLGVFILTPSEASSLPGPLPVLDPSTALGIPYVIGNLGGRIYGEILGGVVSAGAWINLQLIGPYPFSFRGTVGMEGCLVFICHSTSVTVGLNSDRGFYVD